MERIALVGAGYVGLTTAACLAHLGHDVVCADVDEAKIDALGRGELPIVEAGLGELVAESLRSGRLRFVVDTATAVAGASYIYLCVPTPQGLDGAADLTHLEQVTVAIGDVLDGGAIIVNKSTVPVGSTKVVEKVLRRPDVAVVSNPEFLREGSAVHDFLHPDRIVIGSDDRAAAVKVASLYLGIPAPLIVTDPATAELIKYAANAFLATKLSFINAVAALSEHVGADVADVVMGVGLDKRIGQGYLKPGPGWGGSCLPKDTAALVHMAEEAGYDFSLLRGVIAVNDEQRDRVVAKVRASVGGALASVRVASWGLSFKAGTDDRRESPALAIIERLRAEGAEVVAYDPTVKAPLDGVGFAADPYAACEGAEVLVVLTEWDDFRWLDLRKVGEVMRGRTIVDARNLLTPAEVRRGGFTYVGIGR